MGAGKGFFTNYPKHVFLILGNEFCERFSFYGMKAILVLFLTRALGFTDDAGTAIYHGFNVACYFMPLFGAMIADGYLGKYKTIFIISIVYAIGNVVMAVGSIPFDGTNFNRVLPFTGLVLIAIGTGGIKPCVSAFGADQFDDSQARQKETFFSMFYMAINLGSLGSMIITPIIRSSVSCFGQECYALAFGIPAGLMVVAVLFFIAGTSWYTRTPPGDNVIGKLFGCIFFALGRKCSCSGGSGESREHWLDYADSAYDKRFIEDVKSVMRVLFMFLPLPVFWALFDQQGSRWILQAGLMNGDFGGFVLQPDLIQVLNPLLVVAMVPLMESLLFPCLERCNIPNSPLQRLGFGMFLAGTAFVITGLLQIGIDRTLPPQIANQQARFKVLNAVPCDVMGDVTLVGAEKAVRSFNIPYSTRTAADMLKTTDVDEGNYRFHVNFAKCVGSATPASSNTTFFMDKTKSFNIVVYWDSTTNTTSLAKVNQPILAKTSRGKSKFQFFNTWPDMVNITVEGIKENLKGQSLNKTEDVTVNFGDPKVTAGGKEFTFSSKAGAVSTIVFHYSSTDGSENAKTATQFLDLAPNSLNILWQVPQYFVMSLGEVFFSVTGLSFAYSQAPTSMKAVLQAAWLLTNSFGNLLVMIITSIGKLPNQMAEFFLFAGLMYVTVVIFAFMSITYKYVDNSPAPEPDDKPEKELGVDNVAMTTADELPPKYDVATRSDTVSPAANSTVNSTVNQTATAPPPSDASSPTAEASTTPNIVASANNPDIKTSYL